MPTGNRLGTRSYFKYTSDANVDYKYQTDTDLGEAAGAELNDALPDLPRRFKPRGVYCSAVIGGKTYKKFVICPTADNTLFAANVSQEVEVDTETFFTTSRIGEKQIFGANPTVAAPPTP